MLLQDIDIYHGIECILFIYVLKLFSDVEKINYLAPLPLSKHVHNFQNSFLSSSTDRPGKTGVPSFYFHQALYLISILSLLKIEGERGT